MMERIVFLTNTITHQKQVRYMAQWQGVWQWQWQWLVAIRQIRQKHHLTRLGVLDVSCPGELNTFFSFDFSRSIDLMIAINFLMLQEECRQRALRC